jgi:hypothetical protein
MLQTHYCASSCQCLAFVYVLAEDKNKGIGLWHSDSLHEPHADNIHQWLSAGRVIRSRPADSQLKRTYTVNTSWLCAINMPET